MNLRKLIEAIDNPNYTGFTPELKKAILGSQTFQDDKTHEAIMNLAYDLFSKGTHGEMLDFTEEKYGKLAKLAVMLGNFNQQVTNGGLQQYWDNGYASKLTSGFGVRHEDMGRHIEMMEIMVEFKLNEAIIGRTVYDIMDSFVNNAETDTEQVQDAECPECQGAGEIETYDEVEEEYYPAPCEACDGKGHDEIENENYGEMIDVTRNYWNKLTDEYYNINIIWLKLFNDFLTREVNETPPLT